MATQECGHAICIAFEGNVLKLDAGFHGEFFNCQMRCGAVACRAEGKFAGIGFGIVHQIFDGFDGGV